MRRSLKLFSATTAVTMAVALGFSAAAVAGGSGDQPPTEQDRGQVSTLAVPPNPEMLYVALTPCRVVDTREAGGRLSAGSTRSFHVTGTTNFSAQGGAPAGCGIPAAAQSVSAVLTAIEPSKAGYLRAWPAGTTMPTANMLSFGKTRTGTGATLSITPGTAKSLTVKSYKGSVHLVIDVYGYFVPQMQAYISSTGTIIDQSGRLVSASKTNTGQYTLTWDRNVGSCSGQASSDITGHVDSVYTSGSDSYVYVYNNAGASEDYWFNVLITC